MHSKPEQVGCFGFFLKLLGISPGAGARSGKNDLPYRLRDKFLSATELAFYRVLDQAVGERKAAKGKHFWACTNYPPNAARSSESVSRSLYRPIGGALKTLSKTVDHLRENSAR